MRRRTECDSDRRPMTDAMLQVHRERKVSDSRRRRLVLSCVHFYYSHTVLYLYCAGYHTPTSTKHYNKPPTHTPSRVASPSFVPHCAYVYNRTVCIFTFTFTLITHIMIITGAALVACISSMHLRCSLMRRSPSHQVPCRGLTPPTLEDYDDSDVDSGSARSP